MSNNRDPSQSINIGRPPMDVDDITLLQSPSSLDDSKQDHPLIRNSVTSDSTYRDEQKAQRQGDDGRKLNNNYCHHGDDDLRNLPSRDDADLINDIMNQKSGDEDYDFKLVETMDEDDDEHIENRNSMSPSEPAVSSARANSPNESTSHPRIHDNCMNAPAMSNNSTKTSAGGANSQASVKPALKKPFHAPKLMLPHQIAALEKRNQAEQQQNHSTRHPSNPSRTSSVSSYIHGQARHYNNFNLNNPLQSGSSISSYHPPATSVDQVGASPPTMSHTTKSSNGTHASRKRIHSSSLPDDGETGVRLPVVVNMKRNRNDDANMGGVSNNNSNVRGNSNASASFEYDPYNCINHIQPHYTSSTMKTGAGGQHRRNWSSSSTASSLSAGGLSSSLSSATSFDHGRAVLPDTGSFERPPQKSSNSQSSNATTSYSKFDLLSMEDTSVPSSRMFTASGKPFSTSPIMGVGSNSTVSTVSSIAVKKNQKQRKQTTNGNGLGKLDPGVTPISKNTRRDRGAPLDHPYHHLPAGRSHHENTFSFTETPIAPSSAAPNRRNNNNNNSAGAQMKTSNHNNGGRNSSRELDRQNSFTPIPMNPSDDIDDVHNMTITPNLSWPLMGETSPLGEMDGIDPWSLAASTKDPWSRGNAHDILSTLSPNSDTGIKSPCLSNVFDQPHPEERENMSKGRGHYHPYNPHHHQQQQPSSHSSSQGYPNQSHIAQMSHPFPQHGPHSTQAHHMFRSNDGRTPMKPNFRQEPHCPPGDLMGRHHPPPTPMGNTWSNDHYGPPATSSSYPTGTEHPIHVKSSRRIFPNHAPHHNYSVDSRDDANTSRGAGNYYQPPPPNTYRPPAGGPVSDRVINLRGRIPPHHGSHAPPPPHHFEHPSQHAPPHHHHHHHHPEATRSPWGSRPGPAIGQHHPHSHSLRHVPSSSSHSLMAPPSSQHAAAGVDAVHSRRKCAPLKAPIPSKFQGDTDKFKDANVPEFTNLVNYPTNIANKMAAMAGEGMKICVMCGASCPCSSLPKGKCKGGSDKDDGRGFIHHHKQPPNAHKLNGTATSAQGCYAIIPTQNKGLCTFCDVNVWVVIASALEIKWCKGCKNFRPWAAFGDKGLATKCVRCRDRQREKYALQKEEKEKTRGDDISVSAIES